MPRSPCSHWTFPCRDTSSSSSSSNPPPSLPEDQTEMTVRDDQYVYAYRSARLRIYVNVSMRACVSLRDSSKLWYCSRPVRSDQIHGAMASEPFHIVLVPVSVKVDDTFFRWQCPVRGFLLDTGWWGMHHQYTTRIPAIT